MRKALDGVPRLPLPEEFRKALDARKNYSWVSDYWRTSRGPGRLAFHEYFYYRLYDVPESGRDAVTRYVGKRVQNRMHRACNDMRWHAACNDKILFHTIAEGAGLPVPQTVACFHTLARTGPGRSLTDAAKLRRFLGDASVYPLFAKPADGMYSIGAMHLAGLDGDRTMLKGGKRVSQEEVIEYICGLTREGYLLQKPLQPHPDLQAVFGEALVAVRLLMLSTCEGPRLESAVVKVPSPANVGDNFWREGNMLGALDPCTGCMTRLVVGPAAQAAGRRSASAHGA
jgi:hypothetical protein